jgi:Transposase DDE domain
MEHPAGLSQWVEDLASGLPLLSEAQRRVLAQWCFAMEETGLCACHTLAVFLSLTLGDAWQTVRQRLREWYWAADDKQGRNRREVDVRVCFAPLARWVLAHWSGRRVALALAATHLGDRLTILAVSIVYQGCAVPIAWKILPANQKHAWNPEWRTLLDLVAPAFPADWQVIVLTDRGRYSRAIYQAIVAHGWHPFMRVNSHGTFHPAGSDRRQRLADFVPRSGTSWASPGIAFTGADRRLPCTLLACWEDGYKDPWCILTDLAATDCSIAWYGLRNWIEQEFRTQKRGFWHWEHTRMTDPARAERVWLPMALCTFKLLTIGAALEQDTSLPIWGTTVPTTLRRRATRLVRLGWLALRAAQATRRPLPHLSALSPDPWPDRPLPATLPPARTTAVA